MSKNIIFQKSYTRDNSLIIQQLWFGANNQMLKKYLGIDDFFGIDYMNNGVTEVWENTSLVKVIREKLVKMSVENKLEILNILNEYKSELVSLEKVWQGPPLSRKELSLFIERIGSYMLACLIYIYLSTEEKVDSEIKNICADLRSKDHFFASSDSLFRESLKKIFPEVAPYAVCIRKEEIQSGIPTLEVLKSRYNNFLYFSNGGCHIQPLKDYKLNNPQIVFNEDAVADVDDILFGQIANKGKAVGKVRIISKIEDSLNLKEGDIAVSPMTTPAMTVGLKRVLAIVTDEGGVLSHASVISREFNIPCIVGTKIATQVFKDGDLVEVDAEKGIVRKIKSA